MIFLAAGMGGVVRHQAERARADALPPGSTRTCRFRQQICPVCAHRLALPRGFVDLVAEGAPDVAPSSDARYSSARLQSFARAADG